MTYREIEADFWSSNIILSFFINLTLFFFLAVLNWSLSLKIATWSRKLCAVSIALLWLSFWSGKGFWFVTANESLTSVTKFWDDCSIMFYLAIWGKLSSLTYALATQSLNFIFCTFAAELLWLSGAKFMAISIPVLSCFEFTIVSSGVNRWYASRVSILELS